MKEKKAQMEICKRLLEGKNVSAFMLDDGKLFTVIDEIHGAIIAPSEAAINVAKINFMEHEPFDPYEIVKKGTLLQETDDFRRIHGEICQRFIRKDGRNVFVEIDALKIFEEPLLYQGAFNGPVVVAEINGIGMTVPVGAVASMIEDEEDDLNQLIMEG